MYYYVYIIEKASKIFVHSPQIHSNSRTHLQLLLLVRSNDFELTVDHGGLGQVEGVAGHQRERGGGPARPPVQVQGGRAVVGRGHGPEPRRAPRRGAAHAGGGDGKPWRIPENLPVG